MKIQSQSHIKISNFGESETMIILSTSTDSDNEEIIENNEARYDILPNFSSIITPGLCIELKSDQNL
ncbi:MAG: hypothetical protein GTO02_02440 [Candidatus Dadabacteria bacterium]|nr:hypothetical protein [Candidatus Dadabacteria bacterium]